MGVNFSGWGGLNFSAKTPKRDPEFLVLEPRYGVFRRSDQLCLDVVDCCVVDCCDTSVLPFPRLGRRLC